jgi:transcriptional regulator with PAS, ATPase and Fis domain
MTTATAPSCDPSLFPPQAERFARLVAPSPDPVLLQGETGSGKTRLARLIHDLSRWRDRPFVNVNCAAIPDTLFEREMFGHVRGAFTDAKESRAGLLEAASGGTLFLDEIGELPLNLQPKLLQVLEEGSLRRLGSTQATPARFRLVSATNRDLLEMMGAGRFRGDLYYRCAVLECRIPSLRERKPEIAAIVARILSRAPGSGGDAAILTPEVLAALCAYDWPGNIRELENCLRQALVYAEGGPVRPEHLPERVRLCRTVRAAAARRARSTYTAPADTRAEREMIVHALHAEGGNRTRAARRLGMSRATLWIKLQRYALVPAAT